MVNEKLFSVLLTVTAASLKVRYVFVPGQRHLNIDSLAEKMLRRARFACLVGRDSSHSSSESTHTCLLILKSTDLDKFSISMPTPLISFFNPTATAANPLECVILPQTESGQHGSLVSGFLKIGSDSRPNLESASCAHILPNVNSARLFCESNDSAIACSSGWSRRSCLGGFCPQ